jgi:hypothetical protein
MQEATPTAAESAQRVARRVTNPMHTLLLLVLARLPADTRLRCAEVARAWFAAVADPSLWTHVSLTAAAGVAPLPDARFALLLRAAAARAGGQLQVLDVRDRDFKTAEELTGLFAVLRANAASLTHLRLLRSVPRGEFSIETLLAAAPALCKLHTGLTSVIGVTREDAHLMLRNEPPFGPLRLDKFAFRFPDGGEAHVQLLDVMADARAHASLREVRLVLAPLQSLEALNAVVDAALALPLSALDMVECRLDTSSVPSLVRLLGSPVLSRLHITNISQPFLLVNAAAGALLSDALRASRFLVELRLEKAALWHIPEAGAAVMNALVGHPCLQTLQLDYNGVNNASRKIAGDSLAALMMANTPALQNLSIDSCGLGDAGMGPIFHALRHNTHLRSLRCDRNNISAAFAAQRLLPAVRANTSLRYLWAERSNDPVLAAAVGEAEQLVAARAAAADGAAQQ